MSLNIGARIANTGRNLVAYTRPRPDTIGDTPVPLWESGAIVGGLQGWLSGGPITGVAGLMGGFAGVKTAEMAAARYEKRAIDRAGDALLARVLPTVPAAEHAQVQALVADIKKKPDALAILAANGVPAQNTVGENLKTFFASLGGGAATGALFGGALTASLAVAFNHPLGAASIAMGGLLGGLGGMVGTLSGSRLASTRDGVYGGMMLGLLLRGATGNPFAAIAAAVGGGIGGKTPTVLGRVTLGSVSGALTGAATAAFAGPAAAGTAAAVGAALGAGGALIGPIVRQVIRNICADMTSAISSKLEPYLAKHPPSPATKVVLGGVATALMLGPLGMLFGLNGIAVGAGLGMAWGSIATWRKVRHQEAVKQAAARAAAPSQAASAPTPTQPTPAPADPEAAQPVVPTAQAAIAGGQS